MCLERLVRRASMHEVRTCDRFQDTVRLLGSRSFLGPPGFAPALGESFVSSSPRSRSSVVFAVSVARCAVQLSSWQRSLVCSWAVGGLALLLVRPAAWVRRRRPFHRLVGGSACSGSPVAWVRPRQPVLPHAGQLSRTCSFGVAFGRGFPILVD